MLDRRHRLRVSRPPHQQRRCAIERIGQREVERKQRDQRGEIARGELAGGMAVRQRGGVGTELERVLRDAIGAHPFVPPRAVEPHRRDAHHAAASLAGVAGPLAERRALAQRIDDHFGKLGFAGGGEVVNQGHDVTGTRSEATATGPEHR